MPDDAKKAQRMLCCRRIGSIRSVLLSATFATTVSCTHSQTTPAEAQTSKQDNPTQSANSPATRVTTEILIRALPEIKENSALFARSQVGQRLSHITGRESTPQDTQNLIALRALLIAQREIREQRPGQARELAKFILSTPHLSTQLYVFALRYLAVADAIQLSSAEQTNNTSPETSGSTLQNQIVIQRLTNDPKREFNLFQSLQRSAACKTPGWQTLAQEDPTLLSPEGYKTRLLSESSFRAEQLPQPEWLKDLFLTRSPKIKKESTEDGESLKPSALTPLQRVLKLRALVDNRSWTQASSFAKKVLAERAVKEHPTASNTAGCSADRLFAHYALAQVARISQDRRTFARLQTNLIDALEQTNGCTAADFGFEKEQFDSFKLDNLLWLARLQWEQNKNPEGFHTIRKVIGIAASLQSWEHYTDAIKIMVGRIGFEMLSVPENLSILDSFERNSSSVESEEFQVWINSRRGLFHFLEGNFSAAIQSFERVIEFSSEASQRAMAFYWLGRSHQAAKRTNEGENALLSAGLTDPLGIYDNFSGQLLARESGRASTEAKQAFDTNWKEEHDTWLEMSEARPLKIAASVPPRTRFALQRDPVFEASLVAQQQFDISLETSILFISLLRATMADYSVEEFSGYLRESSDLIPSFLRAENAQLRQSFQKLNTLHSEVLPRAHQVAWLTHVLGDHANAILFVGRLREALGWDTDYLPFLYFIFYPRPYLKDFQTAAQRCSVDLDLLYAISRQESLFQPAVRSPVGAVGLMQLLPTTASRVLRNLPDFSNGKKIDLTSPATNTIAGACYLKQLLDRYKNNLTFAIAAYNAGEGVVDRWAESRQKITDMPFFIEFIPYSETKTYVQRVLRNYYNLKWIYRTKSSETEKP